MKRSTSKGAMSIRTLLILAIALVIIEGIASVFAGRYPLTFDNLISGHGQSWRVLLTLRIPRTCVALLGGFAFGVAGMVYQTVFRNPLASPDIIGVSSGASAGAAFALLFLPVSSIFVTASAFAGSLAAVMIALGLSALALQKSKASVILAGIAVHSLAQTVLMALKLTADPERELASIEYWIMGSLNAITLDDLPFMALISTVSMAALFLLYRQILLLSMDEEEAALLGVSVGKLRVAVLLLATLVVASVVSVTGLISFIGLLAPHIARLSSRSNRLSTLWLSGFCGSALLCLADILARSAAASELPVSIFTSLLGAPFMVYLLMKKGAVG